MLFDSSKREQFLCEKTLNSFKIIQTIETTVPK